ncbi:MAG: lipopolysaccharide heptosyltransferase I, partial [Betaproteobacteria bacterium]|nr:lipopolysaccharide heptosyltransferase I [Betaproteobacteria bacterium]
MRVLLVKLSSLGDVIHNLPVVSDICLHRPDIDIDWVTEAPYAGLVALHPGVRQVLPIRLRALKKNWWRPASWSAFLHDRQALAGQRYDRVIDTQGLVKSAWVARAAAAPIAGFSPDTVREPWATHFYQEMYTVSRQQHAVVRNRQLAAQALGYELNEAVDYGIKAPALPLPWLTSAAYVVLLPATSRANKQWPVTAWIELAKRHYQRGLTVVIPWGNAAEKATSETIAAASSQAVVPPALSLVEAAALLAGAQAVVGVDTGLAHLAVALNRPTVGIYLTTQPKLTGLYGGERAINLGGGSQEA